MGKIGNFFKNTLGYPVRLAGSVGNSAINTVGNVLSIPSSFWNVAKHTKNSIAELFSHPKNTEGGFRKIVNYGLASIYSVFSLAGNGARAVKNMVVEPIIREKTIASNLVSNVGDSSALFMTGDDSSGRDFLRYKKYHGGYPYSVKDRSGLFVPSKRSTAEDSDSG